MVDDSAAVNFGEELEIGHHIWGERFFLQYSTYGYRMRLAPIYSRAGMPTVSYVHLYQVPNTPLRINYLTFVCSSFGPCCFSAVLAR